MYCIFSEHKRHLKNTHYILTILGIWNKWEENKSLAKRKKIHTQSAYCVKYKRYNSDRQNPSPHCYWCDAGKSVECVVLD